MAWDVLSWYPFVITKRKERYHMKLLLALLSSAGLAASLLAVPCFAAEPEDLPEQPGVTDPQQPEDPEQPENPYKPGIQPCDAMPRDGKLA